MNIAPRAMFLLHRELYALMSEAATTNAKRRAMATAQLQPLRAAARGVERTISPASRRRHLITKLLIWWQRARQRHELAQLSEAQLRDIGVTRGMARYEADKPFWQP